MTDCNEELRQLHDEIDGLRASAIAQEEHLVAVTEEMDAMLLSLEKQRNDLSSALAKSASMAGLLDRINETVEDMIVFADTRGLIQRVNSRQAEAIGYDPKKLIGMPLDSLLTDTDLQAIASQLPAGALNSRGLLCEIVCACGRYSGEVKLKVGGETLPSIWQLRAAMVVTSQGKTDGVIAMFTDITSWREAETEMRLAANVYESTAEAIMVTDIKGVILSVNPAFTKITGFSAAEAVGQTPRLLKSDHHDKDFFANMWKSLAETGSWQGDVWNRRKNGELFLKRGAINMISDASGKPSRYVSIFNDYTETWEKDEHTRHLAFHDALTGLANRTLLEDRLQHALDMAKREEHQMALMFIDLDRFKHVNDTLGHDVGDDLLKVVSELLQQQVRTTDTVARMGGDEFVMLIESPPNDRSHLALIASRVVESLGQPIKLRDHTVHIGASIGLAIYPDHGDEPSLLMKHADAAMYAAKTAGKNTYRFYSAEMTENER